MRSAVFQSAGAKTVKIRRKDFSRRPHPIEMWRRIPKLPLLLATLLVAGAAGVFGFYKIRTDNVARRAFYAISEGRGFVGIMQSIASAPARYLGAMLDSGELDTLQIDIKFRNWQKLLRKRRDALEAGVLVVEPGDEVKATVFTDGRNIPVKIRLKGDWLDHLVGHVGWSFRVKVRGSDHVYGMRSFSIQHPRSRSYYTEPLFLKHLRSADVLAPRYTFARVVVNGRRWGVMAIEEHFQKELLESQGRKENPLGRVDEGVYWQEKTTGQSYGYLNNYQTNPFEPFNRGKLERDPRLKEQTAIAEGLFAAFQMGRIPVEHLFDLDLFARFVVICEAWHGYHALRWHNIRLYLNPYSLKFEPVAYDHGERVQLQTESAAATGNDGELIKALLREEPMQIALAREVEQLSGTVNAEFLRELLKTEREEALRAIPLENPLVAPPDLDIVEQNLSAMRHAGPAYFRISNGDNWDRSPPEDPVAFEKSLVYVKTNLYDTGRLEIINRLHVPLEIEELRLHPVPTGDQPQELQSIRLELKLPPTVDITRPSWIQTEVPAEMFPDRGRLEVVARIPGANTRRAAAIERSIPYFEQHPLLAPSDVAQLANDFDWLIWRPEARQLEVLPGQWIVDVPIVLPEGVPLLVPAGVVLRFTSRASIRLSAPLNIQGTARAPVVLQSTDVNQPWGGIFVNEAGETSHWEHVRLEDTRAFEENGLVLTGAITFRKSAVEMKDVSFRGTTAEDALNLVRSSFSLEAIRVVESRSDGLDSDFCKGSIKDSVFLDIGGDALDLSGTEAEVRNSVFERVRDKAVSAGERSRLEAQNLTVRASGAAVVSKDGSDVTVVDADVDGIELAALMAYKKKPEFGPATMRATAISVRNAGTQAVAQVGSRIVLEGVVVDPVEIDVARLYTTGPMKK